MRLLFIAFLVLLFSACLDDPDCVVTSTNIVRISLKKIDSDSAQTIKFSRITVSGTDSIFHQGDSVSFVSLPINPGTTETKFKFFYGLKIDTLVVTYGRTVKLVSPPCGAFAFYQNLNVLSTSFLNVKVTNHQLSTSATNNLEIKL